MQDTQPIEDAFWIAIRSSNTLRAILLRSSALDVPQWHIGAGCICQTVWNLKSGNSPDQFIQDIDWVYYDASDVTVEAERRVEEMVRAHFADIPMRFDVKNQARVHLWYAEKFGYAIPPYSSIEQAVATWPTTATAVAISSAPAGNTLIAPFGLQDLMGLVVRPNKTQITESIYLSKVARWKKCWPSLRIVSW